MTDVTGPISAPTMGVAVPDDDAAAGSHHVTSDVQIVDADNTAADVRDGGSSEVVMGVVARPDLAFPSCRP